MQKAILTFVDKANGAVDIKLTFEPGVESKSSTTPAIATALKALELLMREERKARGARHDEE